MDIETAVSVGLKGMAEGADGGRLGIAKWMMAWGEAPCSQWRQKLLYIGSRAVQVRRWVSFGNDRVARGWLAW